MPKTTLHFKPFLKTTKFLNVDTPHPSPVASDTQRNSWVYTQTPSLLLDLCNIAKVCDNCDGGGLLQNWEPSRSFGNVFSLETSYLLPVNYPQESPLTFLWFLLWELHSMLSQYEGLPVDSPSTWSLFFSAGSNNPLAAWAISWCSRVKLLPSEFFSHKVTLATTKSPLHWDKWKTPNSPEGVRWEFTTSETLILTQALPGLQPSIVREGSAGCPCVNRNHVTVWSI